MPQIIPEKTSSTSMSYASNTSSISGEATNRAEWTFGLPWHWSHLQRSRCGVGWWWRGLWGGSFKIDLGWRGCYPKNGTSTPKDTTGYQLIPPLQCSWSNNLVSYPKWLFCFFPRTCMKSPPQSEGLDPFSGRILEKEDSRLGWCRFFHVFFYSLVEWQLAWWSSNCQIVMLGEGPFWWVFWKVAPVARFRFVGRPHAVGSLRNLPAPRFGPRRHVLWAVGQLEDSMDLLWDWQNYRSTKPANHPLWMTSCFLNFFLEFIQGTCRGFGGSARGCGGFNWKIWFTSESSHLKHIWKIDHCFSFGKFNLTLKPQNCHQSMDQTFFCWCSKCGCFVGHLPIFCRSFPGHLRELCSGCLIFREHLLVEVKEIPFFGYNAW